jgi:septal ring factor EnvC (AmiA/AmiB activator)
VVNISATFEKTIDEIKTSFRKGFCETNKLISDLQDKSKGLEFGMGKLEESLRAVEIENKKLKDDIVDLKSRSTVFEHPRETKRDTG